MEVSETCIAPINIAVIKYWGKSDEVNIIPLNDSISMTLDTENIFTKTTAITGPHLTDDSIILNHEESSRENQRFRNCLAEVRKFAASSSNAEMIERSKWKVKIISENNFPTKAGLASSASGYACLVYTLARLYEWDVNNCELSALARKGSGSACRSLFGGFVRWFKGEPSVARSIAPASHWPELRCLVAVVSSQAKTVGSTEGMRRSVATSSLLQHRVNQVVPQRVELMQQAILDKDFETFARLTMQDSNQFHAVCLDTYPPLFYLNGTSQAIIQLVHRYNDFHGRIKVAYTFDAGPNAFLFLNQSELEPFGNLFHCVFSKRPPGEFFRGRSVANVFDAETRAAFQDLISNEQLKESVQYVISCRVGDGPQKLT